MDQEDGGQHVPQKQKYLQSEAGDGGDLLLVTGDGSRHLPMLLVLPSLAWICTRS